MEVSLQGLDWSLNDSMRRKYGLTKRLTERVLMRLQLTSSLSIPISSPIWTHYKHKIRWGSAQRFWCTAPRQRSGRSEFGWPALGRKFEAGEKATHVCQDITETIHKVQCRVDIREGDILAFTSGGRAGDFLLEDAFHCGAPIVTVTDWYGKGT